jgi:L-threonylcarbamoyladenylate synthase
MSQAEIIDGADERNIVRAAKILKNGQLVGFPTETVYGLGADALNPKAVCRIFEVKKRPSFNPLIVHVLNPTQAGRLWRHVPKIADVLMDHFWPGPLTLVLPKAEIVPDVVTGGLETVAVRMPRHPVALELLRSFGGPIAAPSANLFGCTSPTSAAAVREDLGDMIDLILDGGHSAVGVESTVLKIEGNQARILRPGGVTSEEIQKFCRLTKKPMSYRTRSSRMESPGMLASHYAPQTPLKLLSGSARLFLTRAKKFCDGICTENGRRPKLGLLLFKKRKMVPRAFDKVLVLSPSGRLDEAASNLFQAIRKLDKMRLDLIVAESVPKRGIGLAIMDRLERAATKQIGGEEQIENA